MVVPLQILGLALELLSATPAEDVETRFRCGCFA